MMRPSRTAIRHDDGPLPRDYACQQRRQRERLAAWIVAIALFGVALTIIAPGIGALIEGKL